MDLTTLVDPYALEMDQDYDCVAQLEPALQLHHLRAGCIPESSEIGTQIYTDTYGSYGASYSPVSCP